MSGRKGIQSQAAQTLNCLQEHGILSYEELTEKTAANDLDADPVIETLQNLLYYNYGGIVALK